MTRILVTGGAGFHNAGDEMLLLATMQLLRKTEAGAKITVATANPDCTRTTLAGFDFGIVPSARQALFGGDTHYRRGDTVFRTRWHLLRDLLLGQTLKRACYVIENSDLLDFVDRAGAVAWLRALDRADVLVVHGGGILTSPTRSRLWEHALTIEIAKAWGKRVLLRSHQFGPFDDTEDKRRARTILNAADFFTTRDLRQSSRAAAKLAPGVQVIDCVDDALRVKLDRDADAVLGRYGLAPRGYICVAYRDNPGVGTIDSGYAATAEIVRMARRRFRLPVVLLPQTRPDVAALDRLGKRMRRGERALALRDPLLDPVTIAEHARLMIAVPHHSLIFALRGGTPILSPVMGSYYRFKNIGSMRFFGLEDHVVDIEGDDWRDRTQLLLDGIAAEGDAAYSRLAAITNRLIRNSRGFDKKFAASLR